MRKTSQGFEPLPERELNAILGWTFGHAVNSSRLHRGLRTVAKALNDGELARAMIATQFLLLSPLNEREQSRAQQAISLLKAAVDDPKHPGWPRATPGGRGGQFRPKDASLEDIAELKMPALPDARQLVITRMERKLVRAAIKTVLRRMLTFKRIVRFLGETASNLIPGLDAIGDAAMVYDIADIAGELTELRNQGIIARAWVEHGPYTLGELRASSAERSFDSFDAFKKIRSEKWAGPAGNQCEYHHIIPQASDLPPRVLNSTENIVRLPALLHQLITEEWAELAREDGLSLKDYLNQMSYAKQRSTGLKILREFGILK